LDLLSWTYFPSIIAGSLPSPDAEPARGDDTDFFVRRAAARLEVGAIAEAQSDLERAHGVDASDARIDALRAIIASVSRDHAAAAAFAASALAANPDSVEALLASSYVRQAAPQRSRNAHAAAVRDVQRALDLDPTSGLASARLAEVYLAGENFTASAAAARAAAGAAPDSSAAFTILGFALYGEGKLDEALATFEHAIELESMAPQAWHGAALVLWQQRRRDEARESAEIALILDPANVDTRSTLAKIYVAEALVVLSGDQLALAERLNPEDPTPPLLRSYQEQLANPLEAWHAYRRATQRNAGLPPSRSTFALYTDDATEAFGLSRIFIDLDAPALGAAAARKMLAADPTSAAAHLLNADLAATEPFSQQAAINDAFMTQVLSPSVETPENAQRDQLLSPNARVATPRALTATDLDQPLSQDGVEASISALTGNRGNGGMSTALSLRNDGYALNLAAFVNESDGYRENQDSEESGLSLRSKLAWNPVTSLLLEVGSFETETGDLNHRFNYEYYGRNVRVTHDADVFRLGLRHDIAAINRARPDWNATLLGSAVATRYEFQFSTGLFALTGTGTEQSVALRHILQTGRYVVDVGAAVNVARIAQQTTFTPLANLRDEQRTVYVYVDRKFGDAVSATFGFNSDDWTVRGYEGGKLNGKVAIVWEPTERTTFRAAYIEAPPPPVASTTRNNGQPDLERTRVAGFPQTVYPNADWTRTRWGAVEHEFSEYLSAGLTFRERSLLRPLFGNATDLTLVDIDERVTRAHVYWLPSGRVSLAATYERDAYANQAGLADFTDFETDRATVDVNYFMGRGFSTSFRVARVRQDGNFITEPDVSYAPGNSEFSVLDAGVSYRLRNRRTLVDLRVNNLSDKRFRYQEPEYDQLTFVPARTVSLTVQYLAR
jgi:tetratricopeptide (TPR) repeat protein